MPWIRADFVSLCRPAVCCLALFSVVCVFVNSATANNDLNAELQHDLSQIDLSCPRCNIILINTELLRADYVGLHDPSSPTHTPNIDRFFSNAIVFEDVSAPAGESYRGNLSVQTAMLAFHFRASEKEIHDFIGEWNAERYTGINKRIQAALTRFPSMAEFFQSAGFRTISMNQGIRGGRYLLLDRGFDEVVNWSRQRVSFPDTVKDFTATLESAHGGPFLVHYRPEVLHPYPYYYPESRPRIEDPGRVYNYHRPRFSRYSIRFSPSLSDIEKREVHHRIYAQQVRYMDDELGVVFETIKQKKLDRNSVIVLYSNHGSGLGDNGVDKLAVSYQSCIHVPLLIKHPRIERPMRVKAPVPLIDLVPTLMEMAQLERPEHFEGASLLRNLDREGPHRYLAGRNDYDEYIRKGELKLVVKNGELEELYNVERDPHEARDLKYSLPVETRVMKAALEMIKLSVLRKDRKADGLSE